MKKPKQVIIYTDGGCDPNPGAGGWAAVLIHGAHRKEISGCDPQTTNNRMELTAALRALLSLKERCRVSLFTDSEYLKKGITEWLPRWKRKNWTRKGGALKNVDIWKQLDTATNQHEITWHWVKAHNGIPENERCDELVKKAISKQKKKSGSLE